MIETILGNKTAWKVIRLLSEAPGRGICQEDVRDLLGLGFKSLKEALYRLSSAGILNKKKIGKKVYYTANLSNEFTVKILELMKLENKKLNNLQPSKISIISDFLTQLYLVIDNLDKVYLFGSQAKRTSTESSDFDIALITSESIKPAEKQRVGRILRKFEEKNYNFQIHYFNKKEFEEFRKKGNLLVNEILRDGIELI